MKKLINYLLQGVLYIAPIAITLYIIYSIFYFVDDLLQDWLQEFFHLNIPGLGLLVMIGILVLVGIFGQTIIAKPFKYFFHKLMDKAPFVKVVYSAINDLFSAFVGKEKKFNKPVLVQVNIVSKLEKLGFITEDDLSSLGEKEKIAVYFPHSYNFSGELFIVPKDQVKSVNLPSADVMKFVVSGGVAGWK